MVGELIYIGSIDRLAILDEDGNVTKLHCGQALIVEGLTSGGYYETRVEYSTDEDDWYLTGLYKPSQIPAGLRVRTWG